MIKRVLNIKTKTFEEFAGIIGDFHENKKAFNRTWLSFTVNDVVMPKSEFNRLIDYLKSEKIEHELSEVDMRFPTTNIDKVQA